ncbi:MAG: TAXI family TRAP transporter solute-binding subunit [Kiloniellaceae bacterium]
MHRAMQARRHLRALGAALRGGAAAWVCAALLFWPLGLAAQEMTFFRIGTGSTAGTYFPIGGIIASAISKPPGSRECAAGGSCGVPGLIAVAQSTEGSVANVLGIAEGTLESGLSQADISYWAYNGEGIFKKTGPLTKLRTLANLFSESVHIVVHRNSRIHNVADLRGKRVSIDREGSGTRVDALLILEAYGLGLKDIKAEAFAAGDAADQLRAGELDAFFMVVGTPARAVVDLAEDSLITLVPITGKEAETLRDAYPFFAKDLIPSGTYFNVPSTETLSVGAQWLVSADVPDDVVYQITRALWHPNTRRLLDSGHPKGRLINVFSALDGLVVPLHPGARRYYSEAGIPFPAGTD